MFKQLILAALLISSFANPLCSDELCSTFLDQEIEQLSFYMGYLIGKDHAKNSYGFPTKFEKIVEGMRSGINGESIPGREELIPLIKRMQKIIVERETAHNLEEAESYLKNISSKEIFIEVEPLKLFYSIEKQSSGPAISDYPWLHFKMSELKNGSLNLIYSTYDDKEAPLQVDLNTVVVGFRKGLRGMKVGEARTLYVHPDLAFGLGKLDIAPNRLIVFEVVAIN